MMYRLKAETVIPIIILKIEVPLGPPSNDGQAYPPEIGRSTLIPRAGTGEGKSGLGGPSKVRIC